MPHRSWRVGALVMVAALALAPSVSHADVQAPAGGAASFDVRDVAPGVHVLVPRKPPGLLMDANVTFIVNDDDVVVVDTNLTPASAESSIRALRAITSKPVRFVVNTHWHVDHTSGNQVYRREFPGVEFIAQAQAARDLAEKGAQNRRDMREQAIQFVATVRRLLADGKTFAGTAITLAERASYEADVALTDELIAALATVEIVQPTVVVDQKLTLRRGGRTIEILRAGRSHTHGDLVVFLPAERVAITGDLVEGPTPLIGADQSFIGDWARSLDALLTLGAATYVPGHGPVLSGDAHVRLLRDFMRAVENHAAAAQGRGETLEQARASLDVQRFREAMAGDDPVLGFLFRNYGAGPGLAAAFREGARPAIPVPSVVLPPDVDRVLRDYERAWQAKDAPALAALFADDGFVLSNNRPIVRGREAIRAHYANAGGPLALRAVSYVLDGSTGYIVGAFAREAGGADIGKFVLCLRRGADGRWLISADIDNGVS